jgi:hypothetical protein
VKGAVRVLEQLLQPSDAAISISLLDLLISLSVAFTVAMGSALVYRVTHQGLNYERSFLVTLVLLAPIVAVVMMFIRSNLALSLGMVGALSIIRFRTVIKDSRDMVYLFWAVAIGLGCGTYNWLVATVASAFIASILLALHYLQYGRARHSEYVLVVGGAEDAPLEPIKELLGRHVVSSELRSFDAKDREWELVFELRVFRDDSEERGLIDSLRDVAGVRSVSLLAPQLALPL